MKTLQEQLQETYLQMRGILSEEDNKIITDILALDELSKKTLGRYINRAADNATMSGIEHGRKKAEADEVDRITNRHMSFSDRDKIHQVLKTTTKDVENPRNKAIKRIHGITQATKRLTKEQKETIEGILEEIELDEGTHYHSVWSKSKGEKDWSHHFDADSKEDADEEKYSLKNGGHKVKVLKVAKNQADWRNPEHKAAALKKLNESE